MARSRVSPGGVGDGLPMLPSGDPVLSRWFVLSMIALTIAGVILTVLAFLTRTAPPTDVFPAAERRPPGSATVTHERGQVVLGETLTEETGIACAPNVRLVGDEGGRATVRRAMATLCQQLNRDTGGDLDLVRAGLGALDDQSGIVRIALAAATGVDSSARVEDGVLVVELAPKFQFDNATEAAPFLAHELAHLGVGRWPGAAPDVADELDALFVQSLVCERLRLGDDPPRGCLDAIEVLTSFDPAQALRDAGYPG